MSKSTESLRNLLSQLSKPAPRSRAKDDVSPHQTLLTWLAELRPVDAPESFTWSDYLQDYFTDPDSAPEWARQHKIMFIFHLHTHRGHYMVLIKEASDSGETPMWILSVNVNRADNEIRAQQMINRVYHSTGKKAVDDTFKTIWAENLEPSLLLASLDRAASAILRTELTFNGMRVPHSRLQPPAKDDISNDELVEGIKLLSSEKKRELLELIGQARSDPKFQLGQASVFQYDKFSDST